MKRGHVKRVLPGAAVMAAVAVDTAAGAAAAAVMAAAAAMEEAAVDMVVVAAKIAVIAAVTADCAQRNLRNGRCGDRFCCTADQLFFASRQPIDRGLRYRLKSTFHLNPNSTYA